MRVVCDQNKSVYDVVRSCTHEICTKKILKNRREKKQRVKRISYDFGIYTYITTGPMHRYISVCANCTPFCDFCKQ